MARSHCLDRYCYPGRPAAWPTDLEPSVSGPSKFGPNFLEPRPDLCDRTRRLHRVRSCYRYERVAGIWRTRQQYPKTRLLGTFGFDGKAVNKARAVLLNSGRMSACTYNFIQIGPQKPSGSHYVSYLS